jgi:nitronate monooxygenase
MVLDRLRHPIVLAPLAGGPSSPALTAAVSGAGGLGFFASGYLTAEALRDGIAQVRALTSEPFGVNIFVLPAEDIDLGAVRAYVERLRAEAARYGVDPGEPRYEDDDWDAKLDVLRADPVAVVSFTFECPAPDVVASLKDVGSEIWVTVTDLDEVRAAAAAGADALVVQGFEAGGHRASFTDSGDREELGLLALVRLAAVETALPLVATGGIADGAGVAAALAAGASAAQIGTAFLLAPEAGTNPAHREALAADTPTALTRAFTGRRARGLVNRFLEEHSGEAPSAYPHVHHATAPIRAAARERGDAGGFNLWAGQAHRLAASRPAADIVQSLSVEARAALESARERLGRQEGASVSAERSRSPTDM